MAPVAPQLAGPGAIAVILTIVALLQWAVWCIDRDPAFRWFGASSAITAVLAWAEGMPGPAAVVPAGAGLVIACGARIGWSVGLLAQLAWPFARRRGPLLALALPALALALAASLAGSPTWAALALVWIDLGGAVLCLGARPRRASPWVLAAGLIAAPAGLLVALAGGSDPLHLLAGYAVPAAVLSGIAQLAASLLQQSLDHRSTRAQAERMSNYYQTLTETNQAVLRIRAPAALYQAICDICVETGHAQMACLYLMRDGLARREITAGPAARILAGIPVEWDPASPSYRDSYTARALGDGQRRVCNDYQHDPLTTSWHRLAAQNGIHAMVWLPFRRGERVAAVLMLSATERDYFDAPLLQLLDRMSQDVSFALDFLASEQQRVDSMREAQASLERFSKLFQAAPVPAAIVSTRDRRVLDVNQAVCERDGLPREHFIGKATADFGFGVVPEDREVFYALVAREGRARNFLARSIDIRGRARRVLVNAEPLEYLEQACLLILVLDITELQEAEEARRAQAEAEAANRAKTQFLSHMSHELRTPLNAILGFSTILREEAAERLTPDQRVQLDHVRHAGWHLLTLIDDVLDLARIESGTIKVDARALLLPSLLDEVLDMARPLAAQLGVTLDAAHHTPPATAVRADATRLRQVLLNVLSNAIKYNRPDGGVRVRVLPTEDGDVAIEVADSGIGMTPQQLARLFEPFNRLGRERSTVEGTGIGLALSRQLMALMGGSITVDSQVEVGTQVRVHIPRAELQAIPQDTVPGALPGPAAPALPTGAVLYVEDNAVNTLLIESLFARWPGVTVHTATDGRSGIARARELVPDLVLLDMQLPDVDGLEVLRTLRADETTRRVPIVVLSASAMPGDVERALAEGANDYWTKPIAFERFLGAMAGVLGERSPPGSVRPVTASRLRGR
ncbi:ATP-binding protein [Piscinibacter gummiphilus]|uniref:histidine kinase n=1 Tax=Piscinibacter gummiphilus TaxID=946333 RepID=A0A1W6L460_9BURK|nr:ATP-binding protein [Piscinibacter gummiphilus]ARN18996.1 hypothetical protein A4W93_03160 [Piscinibacter gummiphilus]ATU63642.1 hypothetical protein CPZ87_03235 [Piscinibacter gummiphilus]GLS93434.1 hypothetical protein GCM10007918_07250 [Piscinibacter gummiphilus]